jgi:hypothetical protein
VAGTDGNQGSSTAPNGVSSEAATHAEASSHGRQQILESRLPVELIIAEAKNWGVADEVALQVLPTGRVNVICSGSTAGFAEHLLSLQGAGRFHWR